MQQDDGTFTSKFAELRKRAGEWIQGQRGASSPTLSIEEARKLVHELQTYQIELELQNEDLHLAQIELEQSRCRYTDLYDFAPVGYLTVSDKGLIIESNLTAAAMLGVERQRLLNRSLSAFIVRDDQSMYYHFRKKLLASSQRQTCELRMQQQGSQVYIQLESTLMPDVDGSSGQFRVAMMDISERKELEAVLLRSKTEWEKTFDAISDLITIKDKDMRILRANRAAHEMFHVKAGERNGRYCYEVFRGADRPCPSCPELNTLDSMTTQSATITHENLGRTFHVTSSPLVNEDGEITRIVNIARDITARRKIEAELFQARKMEAVGTLAGGIAHDFNNILAAIIGYADLVKYTLPELSDARNHIDQVLKAGNRAKELVKQILTFSRKGQEIQLPLKPAPIIKEALKLLRASLPTSIEIREEIDTECGTILANPTNIHQVLVNLCTNALHAMEDEKGVLTVKLAGVEVKEPIVKEGEEAAVTGGSFVELMVSDTGCGMTEETLKCIYEPYFTTKDFGKGSGVGLAVVHGIIQGCGGFIKVESELHKGTTFRVYLPAVKEEAVVLEDEQRELLPGGDERILVVDDEEVIVKMHKAILERLGYKVTMFTSSEKLLEYFRNAPDSYDLIITDQTMPRLTGSELIQELLKIRPDLPAILCTGYSSMISEEQAHQAGISKFMMKPVARRDLAVTVREVLDKGKPQAGSCNE